MPRSRQRNARQVAALIAEMMKRSQSVHARLTEVALEELAGKRKLDVAFRRRIHRNTLDNGYLLHRLEGGEPTSGTAIISLKWMYDAALLARDKLFSDDEWSLIERGIFDFDGCRMADLDAATSSQ